MDRKQRVKVNLYFHHNCSPGTNSRSSRICGSKQLFLIIIIFISSCCQWSVSDFNALIPEICHLPKSIKLNLTWVYEMIHLGLRDERTGINLNILKPDEICDGSQGLLKFISLGQEDPNGIMIASLEPQLCPVAAAFTQLRQRQFISWTCSEMPGIISLKPTNTEINGAILNLIRYFNWKNIGLLKSKQDESSYCDNLGNDFNSKFSDNVALNMLGNYEDLEKNSIFSKSAVEELDGFFYCFSYGYGLKENILGKNNEKMWINKMYNGESWTFWNKQDKNGVFGRVPLVLLPEWPLPIEILAPDVPTMALITNPPSSSTSYEFEVTSWEQEQSAGSSGSSSNNNNNMGNFQALPTEIITPPSTPFTKMIELLLAQLILRSVKLGLTLHHPHRETTSYTSSWTPSYESDSNNIPNIPNFNSNTFHKSSYPYYMKWEFLFSLGQYDNGRWHPLINLSDGEKAYTPKPINKENYSKSLHKQRETNDTFSGFEVKSWLQFIVGGIVMSGIILLLICMSLYARKRIRRARGYDSSPTTIIRRKLSRRNRTQGPYKIILSSSDIIFGSLGESNGRKNSKPQFGTLRGPEEKPDLLKVPHGGLRKNSSSSNLKSGSHQQMNPNHCETKARYKGDLVHLRRLGGSSDSLQIKMKTMSILETLHGLRHENVTAMLGCFSENRPISLVWEFCSRGSLHDIIHMPDIKLDWPFKLSLLTDLVRGMRHLHLSLIRVHGKLTSRNCIVDARWVLKVTDYGIPALCQAQGISPLPYKYPKDLLWTAPELLRDENLRKQGTQAGDVYSFAIIMQEVLIRGEPFCMLTLSINEILEKLKHPPPLIRPSVSKGAAPPEAINIMRQCWAELPDMRPDFTVIHDLFKTLNHGRKANIVDTMFQMLEKYSNNLEELIRERTEQLDLEKKKTEQLLNRMLPSTVAEKLKVGLPVDPEDFPEVTIYFSDIVGFTTISAYSTPFEVVDLLNDLYTCFDATINDYNVYKVETIGDAYMVVGGAPVWSQDHADQIATMALDLLYQSGKFRIRHLPYTPLRLRIGIHSGPCCAGVVGLTMPRYCLFGDTVNTASRMESTGSAWRIHISAETKAKLDSIGGYIIQYRGMTAIKGKGQMPTFWLLGKEGFDKELPKPPGPEDKSSYLDERSIMYGRTGVWPDKNCLVGNEFADNNYGNSTPGAPPPATAPIKGTTIPIPNSSSTNKPVQKYGSLLSGTSPGCGGASGAEAGSSNLRSLSPAEQVAHQLLTGKPAFKGLRRQFSLDQGTNSHPLVTKTNFKKAPSLEETSEYLLQHNSNHNHHNLERVGSERKSSSSSSSNSEQQLQPHLPQPILSPKIEKPEELQIFSSPSKLNRQGSSGSSNSSKPILKTRTLSILEESPTSSRKGILKTTQSATD